MTNAKTVSVPQFVKDLFGDRVCPICSEKIVSDCGIEFGNNELSVLFQCPNNLNIYSSKYIVNYIICHYELEVNIILKSGSYTIVSEDIKLCGKDNLYKIINVYNMGYYPHQQICIASTDTPYQFQELEFFAEFFPFDFKNFNEKEFLERLETMRLFG